MVLDKLKEFPKDRILYLIIIISLLLAILVEIFVFIPIEAAVSTYGILDYEFAWNVINAFNILTTWGESGVNSQVIAIYWDFLFIISYVSLAFSLIILALRKSGEKIQMIGTYIAITPFLTGMFDVIENFFLLVMASDPGSITSSFPLIASLSATTKFILLFVGIVYFGIALLVIIIKKIRQRKK